MTLQLVLEDRVRETLKRGGGLERRPDKETTGPDRTRLRFQRKGEAFKDVFRKRNPAVASETT